MKLRLHLFEFEDQPWFPGVVRAGMMDYLRFMITHLHTYRPIAPLLAEGLRRTGQTQVLELCAGAGGGTADVLQALQRELPAARITLTDLYPQPAAWRHLQEQTAGRIGFVPEPVNALQVPPALPGFRAVFSAFHHFQPAPAEALLRDAVQAGTGVGVFEGAGKHWLELLLACTVMPLALLCIMPFVRPFSWSRLLFTYLIPLIPLFTIWDGAVSILRMYPPGQLLALARRADPQGHYHWQAGKVRHAWGPEVTYLVGWPKKQ